MRTCPPVTMSGLINVAPLNITPLKIIVGENPHIILILSGESKKDLENDSLPLFFNASVHLNHESTPPRKMGVNAHSFYYFYFLCVCIFGK